MVGRIHEETILSDEHLDAFKDMLLGNIELVLGEGKNQKYVERLKSMNKTVFTSEPYNRSVMIDYEDIIDLDSYIMATSKSKDIESFAEMLAKHPDKVLHEMEEMLDKALDDVHRKAGIEISAYKPFYIRIKNFDKDTHGLEQIHGGKMEKMIEVRGLVSSYAQKRPLLTVGRYVCTTCNTPVTIPQTSYTEYDPPTMCANPSCDSAQSGKRSLELIKAESFYVDYQVIDIQEEPNFLKGAQNPRTTRIIVIDDSCDVVHSGDMISVTGILKSNSDIPIGKPSQKPLTFDTFVLASSITPRQKEIFAERKDYSEVDYKKKVDTKEKQEAWWKRMIQMIARTISGHDDVKEAIICQLFSGKVILSNMELKRPYAHILIIGEPGTGKTSIAQSLEEIIPKHIYASGKGSSGMGLTAGIGRDDQNKPIVVAGALALADGGYAVIDEIDKARPEDSSAMLDALESSKIFIRKAGKQQELWAREPVLAMGNPKNGVYDSRKGFIENIDTKSISIPLISRFDLIFMLLDINVNLTSAEQGKIDDTIADRILSLSDTDDPPSEGDIQFLREYIQYARKKAETHTITVSLAAKRYLKQFFIDKRRKSLEAMKTGDIDEIPVAITPRYMGSLVRIAIARAIGLLKDEVEVSDAEVATRLLEASLKQISSSDEMDARIASTGKSDVERKYESLLLGALLEVDSENEDTNVVKWKDFLAHIETLGLIEGIMKSKKGTTRDSAIHKVKIIIKDYVQWNGEDIKITTMARKAAKNKKIDSTIDEINKN